MGRRRKPIETQVGNLTVFTTQNRLNEEKVIKTGKNQLKKPPEWLIDDVAKKEWRRLVKELEGIDLIGNLDRNNLCGYCNAFASYVKATKEMEGQDFCIERKTKEGITVIKNPLISTQKLYAEEMRKFASLCGLTVDARLKAAAAKTSKKEEDLRSRFGDI